MLISAAWAVAINDWHNWALTQGLATTSIRTRLDHLHRTARRIGVPDPWEVTAVQLVAYFNAQVWRQETRRGHRASLRCFYGWAAEAGHVVTSPALALPRVRQAPPRPRPLGDRAYVLALAAADARTRLMVRLMAEAGLRRTEVSLVRPERDVFEDLTGWSLTVHGKGGKVRDVPLTDMMAAELLALPAGWAFPGRIDGHLSPRRVGELVSDVLPEGWGGHTLRHRFATRTHEVERDLVLVQELLGHASITTTRAYVATAADRKRSTVNAASGVGPVERVA